MQMRGIWILVLVFAYIFSIVTLSSILFVSVHESFEDAKDVERKLYTMDEARCVECMTFYQDVFQFTESAEIVPYIQKRTEYLKYILRQFLMYNETIIDTCLSANGDKGEPTLQQVMGCFNQLIGDLIQQCQEKGMNRAECSMIQKLNDRAFEKALMCGAKECTVPEFRERYKMEVNAMAQDLLACGEAFAKDTDLCVKMYARIMDAKKLAPNDMPTTPDNVPVTQKELKDEMGKMTAFVMLNG
jgi:hypothetical protein